MLTSYDWLLIRATKDMSPTLKRLRRIWSAGCYVSCETSGFDQYLARHLYEILATTKRTVDLFEVLNMADPEQCWKVGSDPNAPHWTRILLAIVSQIRQTQITDWDNYRSPAPGLGARTRPQG